MRDSTHFQRARNFCYENKFSSEGFLARVHWTLAPRSFRVLESDPEILKSPPEGERFSMAEYYVSG